MGNAAHITAGNKRCVTINLDIKYISAGKLNEEILGKVKVLKKQIHWFLFLVRYLVQIKLSPLHQELGKFSSVFFLFF